MKQRTDSFSMSILLPIALALVILLVAVMFQNHLAEREHIDEEVRDTLRELNSVLLHEIDSRAQLFRSLIGQLTSDPDVRRAFLQGDRETLRACAQPFFDFLKTQYRVSHLYFIEPDRRCFLRMHKPGLHGDLIDRTTAIRADETGHWTDGMELGPLGTFVLRVVVPWEDQGKRLGFLELSEDLTDIARNLGPIFDTEFLVLLDKRLIRRENWEQGRRTLGRKGADWDALPGDAVMMNTLGHIPPTLGDAIARYRQDPARRPLTVKTDHRILRGGTVPLQDLKGIRVADVLVLQDITERMAWLHRTSLQLALVGLGVGCLLFVFFHFYLGRIQRKLAQVRVNLESEVQERRNAEEETRRSKELMELSIESVTHPFLVIDAETYTLLRANSAAIRHAKGHPTYCYNLSHNRDRPCQEPDHVCPLEEVKRTGRPTIVEHVHHGIDGSHRDVEIHAYPVLARDGSVRQVIECIQDITERKKMRQKLENSLHEKELLLEEVHHRVRNNMQAIYGLMDLHCGFVRDPSTVDVFRECQNRILSMAMVHEQLYQQPDLAHINMNLYLRDLTRRVVQSSRGNRDDVAVDVDIEETTFGVETAIPCGIIVNELVSNALKHGFPDGRKGRIRVVLEEIADGEFQLFVSDNGVGFPEDYVPGSAETFGMQMLTAFGEDELGGTAELLRGEETTFRVRFRAKQTNVHGDGIGQPERPV